MFRLSVLLPALAICFCLIRTPLGADEKEYLRKLGGDDKYTPQELKRLPAACIAKEDKSAHEEREKWHSILGESFDHLHHYCNGLNFLNRIKRGIGDKKSLLQGALGEFRYMDHQISGNNPLRPELEYNIGSVLFELNRFPEAIVAIRKSIFVQPDNAQAYLLLSMCYKRMGDSARALDVLQAGLAKVPGSQALRSAMNDLNGAKQDSDKGKQ
jgi:tetratricopeptide (TPR) repeat protein